MFDDVRVTTGMMIRSDGYCIECTPLNKVGNHSFCHIKMCYHDTMPADQPQTQSVPVTSVGPSQSVSSGGVTPSGVSMGGVVMPEVPVLTKPSPMTIPSNPVSTISTTPLTETPLVSTNVVASNGVPSILSVLVAMKALTQEQADDITLEHINTGKPIEAILEDKHSVSEEILTQARSTYYNIPFVNLMEVGVSPEALQRVPESLAKRYHALPFTLDKQNNTLSVAMRNPLDLSAIDFLEKKTGLRILSFYATPSAVEESLAERYAQSLSQECRRPCVKPLLKSLWLR